MHFAGRVRERRCCHSLPSKPDVRVSPHPAQADTKPCVDGAGVTMCHLYDTHLQPPRLADTLGPVRLFPEWWKYVVSAASDPTVASRAGADRLCGRNRRFAYEESIANSCLSSFMSHSVKLSVKR